MSGLPVGAVLVAVPVAAAVATLPAPALAAWILLAAVVGGLAATWTRLTGDPARAPGAALDSAAVALAGGLAVAGSTVLLGPGTVVAIPVATLLLVLAHRASVRTCR